MLFSFLLVVHFLVALVDASRALGARFEITRAEAILDRLMKVAKNNPKLLHLAGQSYRMIFRPDKAMACFQRARAAVAAPRCHPRRSSTLRVALHAGLHPQQDAATR